MILNPCSNLLVEWSNFDRKMAKQYISFFDFKSHVITLGSHKPHYNHFQEDNRQPNKFSPIWSWNNLFKTLSSKKIFYPNFDSFPFLNTPREREMRCRKWQFFPFIVSYTLHRREEKGSNGKRNREISLLIGTRIEK